MRGREDIRTIDMASWVGVVYALVEVYWVPFNISKRM